MECSCGIPANHAQCKHGKNEGKWFYGCGNFGTGEGTCDFFKWEKTSPKLRRANAVVLKRAREPTPPLTQPVEDEIEDIQDELQPKKRSITKKQAETLDRMITQAESERAVCENELAVYAHMLRDATADLFLPGTRAEVFAREMAENLIRQCVVDKNRDRTNLDARIFMLRQQRNQRIE